MMNTTGTDMRMFLWFTISNTFAMTISMLCRYAWDYVFKAAIVYRYYQDRVSKSLTQLALQEIEKNYWMSDGKIFSNGRMIPHGMIIGRRLRYVAFVDIRPSDSIGSMSSESTNITVWTWRWDRPLIPDVVIQEKKDDREIAEGRCIKVMRTNKYDDFVVHTEVTCAPQCLTRETSEHIADIMYDTWQENDKSARFVLYGPTGKGKSMSTRFLTAKVRGVLCPQYNPSKPRSSIKEIIDSAEFHREHPLIVVMEEFDQCIEKINDSNPTMQRNTSDVSTKSDWTSLLDYLQFRPDVILIMITNKSRQEMENIDSARFDGALMREGRVTKKIDVL